MHKINCLFSVLQLQDLAVSPNIRDPQLNSAECVTEGHEPNIMATGQSVRITMILCCSFLFAVLSGPLLALYVLYLQEKQSGAVKKTVDILCVFLIVIFVAMFVCIEVSIKTRDQNVSWYIHAVYPVIMGVGMVVGICICKSCPAGDSKLDCKNILLMMCGNLTAYHFCWLLVGIMLNPTWGLAALLVVCLVIGVFSYAVFTCLCEGCRCCSLCVCCSNDNTALESADNGKHPMQTFFSCLSAFLAVCCLIVVVILAGQSYHGRQNADEVLKDAVLYLISFCFSWLYWKNIASKPETPVSQNEGPTRGPTNGREDREEETPVSQNEGPTRGPTNGREDREEETGVLLLTPRHS